MTKLCVSILIRSSVQAKLDFARAVAAGADIVELRLDAFASSPTSGFELRMIVQELRDISPIRLILTSRTEREGGESAASDAERIDQMYYARGRYSDYIDIEWSAIDGLPTHSQLPPFIASTHDFKGRPERLTAMHAEMSDSAVDVVKLAWQARSIRDNIEAFELMQAGPKPTIAICMGEAGAISRILAKKFGAFCTFASLNDTSATAPGQLTIAKLKNTYRWDAIKPTTKVYGVVGAPVGHSMSPAIHNAAFDAIGFDGVYVPLLVQPGYESFKAFMETFRAFGPLNVAGLSITIPHKENALRYARESGDFEIDEVAERIGAVNTYVLEDDDKSWTVPGPIGAGTPPLLKKHRALSTDYDAILDTITFALAIDRRELKGLHAAVVGAGGTGRTALAALAHVGAAVTILNRTADRANALAAEFGATSAPIGSMDEVEADVWINATSVGMSPAGDASLFDEAVPKLGPKTLVFDTVYNPLETKLLRLAGERGAKTVSGIEMFIRQAASQFELWTGKPAPVELMRSIVVSRLSQHEA